jgi:hypothetical protein
MYICMYVCMYIRIYVCIYIYQHLEAECELACDGNSDRVAAAGANGKDLLDVCSLCVLRVYHVRCVEGVSCVVWC